MDLLVTSPPLACARAPQKRHLKTLDLFAGIGGFRAAGASLRSDDVQFVGSCELDLHAQRTYRAMYPEACGEWFAKDITELAGEKLTFIGKSFKFQAKRERRLRKVLPAADLITAGFPCQPHSLMGNRRGVHDDRGSLFYDIAEIIHALEPQLFILENVRAIKSVNGGRLFDLIVRTLSHSLGYNLEVWEVNAADYGIPQVRRRLFFVGSKGMLPSCPPPKRDLSTALYPTVWHLLERNVDEKYYLSAKILDTILKDQHKGYCRKADINRLLARPLTRTMHKMHRASQDNYYSDVFIHGHYDPSLRSVRLDAEKHERIRRITPREAFRIQSFDEDLIQRAMTSGTSDTQLYMQAGNAVPPMLASAVLSHVLGQ